MLKARVFWPVLLTVLLSDCTSKELAVEYLNPPHEPHAVAGDIVRLTLTYNTGGAMGTSLGDRSRVAYAVVAVAVALGLAVLYRRLPAGAAARALGIGLVLGGALGNLADRLRSVRGVVDFIDLGIGTWRFWTFNIADMAICGGAIVLLWFAGRRSGPAVKRSADAA